MWSHNPSQGASPRLLPGSCEEGGRRPGSAGGGAAPTGPCACPASAASAPSGGGPSQQEHPPAAPRSPHSCAARAAETQACDGQCSARKVSMALKTAVLDIDTTSKVAECGRKRLYIILAGRLAGAAQRAGRAAEGPPWEAWPTPVSWGSCHTHLGAGRPSQLWVQTTETGLSSHENGRLFCLIYI